MQAANLKPRPIERNSQYHWWDWTGISSLVLNAGMQGSLIYTLELLLNLWRFDDFQFVRAALDQRMTSEQLLTTHLGQDIQCIISHDHRSVWSGSILAEMHMYRDCLENNGGRVANWAGIRVGYCWANMIARHERRRSLGWWDGRTCSWLKFPHAGISSPNSHRCRLLFSTIHQLHMYPENLEETKNQALWTWDMIYN